ncbi:hypothetical protein SAY86_007305 [Trapa natans]|uniref:Uncharacterized protein n=1 Tax=Trapa natans TaxID=22666 RepID=A0AAN7LLM2_TRANT|nr:hypothetical protein SAY86_007305 [Trapa natans]
MSSTTALRTGVTFALGAMFGSFMTRAMCYRCDGRTGEYEMRGPWRHCPRQARAPEPSAPENPGPEVTTVKMDSQV